MQETGLEAALGGIYEAALDPTHWDAALASVVGYVGGESAILGINDPARERADLMLHVGLERGLVARWYAEFGQEDPWAKGAAPLDEGAVVTGTELVPLEELRKRRLYREILVPIGIHDLIAGVLAKRRERYAFLSVYRGPDRPLFGEAEAERMARLVPHLQRAAAIRQRLAAAEGRSLVDSAVLDCLSSAVLVCDAERRVLRTNARADALLRDGRVLVRREGRLACRGAAQERRLRSLVRRAVEGDDRAPPAAGALPLAGRAGERGLEALVVPLAPRGRSRGFPPAGPAVLLMVSAPDDPLHVPVGLLRDLYGLTPAEARLAAALAARRSLREHAEDVGVAESTVRWRLKQVFAKTETARQAELVAAVLRSLALVDPSV